MSSASQSVSPMSVPVNGTWRCEGLPELFNIERTDEQISDLLKTNRLSVSFAESLTIPTGIIYVVSCVPVGKYAFPYENMLLQAVIPAREYYLLLLKRAKFEDGRDDIFVATVIEDRR